MVKKEGRVRYRQRFPNNIVTEAVRSMRESEVLIGRYIFGQINMDLINIKTDPMLVISMLICRGDYEKQEFVCTL